MTHQETATLEQFTTSNVGIYPVPDSEINPVDILALLLRRKKLIAGIAILSTCATAAALYLLPPSYKAEATILPPQQQQSSLAALASGAIGGLASSSGMGSQLGLKNPADMYIGILKSRTIADDLIAQFNLKQVYDAKLTSDARKALGNHASFASGKESLITISVKDRDPQRAAAIANAFVDELHKQNSRLALTDASQRRLFLSSNWRRKKMLWQTRK